MTADEFARLERILETRHDSLEQMIAQRHTNLVDKITSILRDRQVEVARLRAEVSALRDDVGAMRARLEALELRPPCALMAPAPSG